MQIPRLLAAGLLFLSLGLPLKAEPLPWIVPIRSTDKYRPKLGLLASKQVAAAIREATDWVKRSPEQAGAFHYLAEALRFGARYDEATEAVNRSLEVSPGNPTGLEIRGKILFDQKRYDAALTDFTEAKRLAPTLCRLPFLIGLCHWWKAEIVEAADAFEQGLALNPEYPAFWNVLSACHYLLGHHEDALEAAKQGFQHTQRIYVGLQSILGRKATPQKVAGIVEAVFPDSPAAKAGITKGSRILNVNRKSTARMTAKEIGEAVEKGEAGTEVTLRFRPEGQRRARTVTVKRVVTTMPNLVEESGKSIALRAMILREMGRRLEGQKELDRALKIAPKAWFARKAKVSFDLDGRRPPAPILELVKGLMEELKNPNPVNVAMVGMDRARVLHRLGREKEAAEAMMEARSSGQIRKDLPPVWKEWTSLVREVHAQEWIARALSLMERKDADALAAIRRARAVLVDDEKEQDFLLEVFAWAKRTKQRPSEAAIRFSLRAQLLFRDKDFTAAATELEKALDVCPFDPGLWCNGAYIMAELRRYSDAIRMMNVYLAAAPDAADAAANRRRVIEWELDLERGRGR